jgi:hypothetical protein
MKDDDIFFFTGTINDNQNLRSKTEEDANKFFNTVYNKEIKQNQKYSNDDDIITSNVLERKADTNEKMANKNTSKNDNSKSKGKQNNNSKKKTNAKDSKKSNKKNNEIRTGKIDIPMLNIKLDNGFKIEEKCITERPNNIKKSEKQNNNSQNKNVNNIKTTKNASNNKIKNMNQLIIKNPSKKSTKKNKTNSQESGNNNFNDMNKKRNKDVQNGNNIFTYFSNENKKVFDKIKINFKSSKNYKYAKSPSDINLLSNNNNNNDTKNDNNQEQYNKVNNNFEFNEADLFSNRINYRNSSKSQNKFGKTTNNIHTNINANNPENKNIISYDKNISNNNGYINKLNNQNNNLSKHFNANQNRKKDKKKSLNIFSNYIKQKNIYNIFNNVYSKNQPHQRNYKSALKYQLTELKTDNKGINNNFFTSNKISVSRNKKSSYNKDYNSVTNTNFITKNKNNNNIIKEYENKFINNNQKHSSSIDDDKINFSISPKYLDKTKNSKDKKIYFINQNILNIDYLLKGKNKKNKLILTSTIGNNNNSPRNVYNIGQNYFGCEFHTEVNVKNNSTNKNKENLSVVLKKGIIKNQKKNSKDIFNLRLNKPKNNKNYSEQINAFNNSNNVYSNKRNINTNKKNKGF